MTHRHRYRFFSWCESSALQRTGGWTGVYACECGAWWIPLKVRVPANEAQAATDRSLIDWIKRLGKRS